ncbi:hypothetical protein HN748_03610 [Candidatus Peregrinibacteria bacterium]|jgi:hypothetical protein|nr:hypothetical protein [Candidatus Peregrinibacteria bacterium]MBT7483585.1 hypothetical protein [Candidatus Peregrinibacteria bacterium]MBT7703296.1 hypothetical protein [Candidatus Peregrinibacteria bacterium]
MENQPKHKRLKVLLAVLGISLVALGTSLASSGSLFQGTLSVGDDPGYITVEPADRVLDDISIIAGLDSDTDPLLVGNFKVYANEESFVIDEIALNFDGTDTNSIDSVILKYPTDFSSHAFDGESESIIIDDKVGFANLDIAIPASIDSERSRIILIYAVTNEVGSGADSGDVVQFSFDYDYGFKAIGQDSGQTITPDNSVTDYGVTADILGPEITLYEAGKITIIEPDRALEGRDVTSLDDEILVGRFNIAAAREDFVIEEMQFVYSEEGEDLNIDVADMILRYPTSFDDPTLDGESTVTFDGRANFDSLNIAVPKTQRGVLVELYIDIQSAPGEGDIVFEYDYDDGFSAVGQESGTTVTDGSSADLYGTTANISGPTIHVMEGAMVLSTNTKNTNCPTELLAAGTEVAVYCFKAQVYGHGSLYAFKLDVDPSYLEDGTNINELGETDGWVIYDGTDLGTPLGYGTYASNEVEITLDSNIGLEDEWKVFVVKAPVNFDSMRSVAATLSTRLAEVKIDNTWNDSNDLDSLPTDYLELAE